MAFIDYGFIAIKNSKIITDLDKLPVEPYKYMLENKNGNSYIQEIINTITVIINTIALMFIMYCYIKGIAINIDEVIFFGVIYICAICVCSNTKTFSEKIRVIAENEEVENNE